MGEASWDHLSVRKKTTVQSLGHDEPEAQVAAAEGGHLLQSLYASHWGELCNYLKKTYGAGPPDPEDVAQIAFTNFAKLDDKKSVRNPRAFLFQSARNIMVDEKRKQQTQSSYADGVKAENRDSGGCEITPENVLMERQRFSLLKAVLAKMPKRRRAMLLLNRLDGISCTDIGRQAGVSEAAVRKQINLALKDCMDVLEDQQEDKT